jgi:SsrA-binding protein
MSNKVDIKNKKARYEYEVLEENVAGIVLTGSEIKSIREGKANISDAYCRIENGEIFIFNMHIAEYKIMSFGKKGHEPYRVRKLLLKRKEIDKLKKKVEQKGFTIIPLKLFTGKSGYAKMRIALVKGKKEYDKRNSLKEKDVKMELDRTLKI